MPFKSKAQRRRFYYLKSIDKMDQKTINEWESKTPKEIPERLHVKKAFAEGFEKISVVIPGTYQLRHLTGANLREKNISHALFRFNNIPKSQLGESIETVIEHVDRKYPGREIAKKYLSKLTEASRLGAAAGATVGVGAATAAIKSHDHFKKKANIGEHIAHGAEIAGLGILAAPSIAHLAGKNWSEKTKSKMEVGGLGVLAAPSVAHFAKKFVTRGK